MEEKQYCKDCKHMRIDFFSRIVKNWNNARCAVHPYRLSDRLIAPPEKEGYSFCGLVRHFDYREAYICPKFEKR